MNSIPSTLTFFAHNNPATLPSDYYEQPKFRQRMFDQVRSLLMSMGQEFAKVEMLPDASVQLSHAGKVDGAYKSALHLQLALQRYLTRGK